MYLPDPIERAEHLIEDWYFENVRNGVAKCGCGESFNIDDGETLSADPYAIPVCPNCAEKYYMDNYGKLPW